MLSTVVIKVTSTQLDTKQLAEGCYKALTERTDTVLPSKGLTIRVMPMRMAI